MLKAINECLEHLNKGLTVLTAEQKSLAFEDEKIGAEVLPYCNELIGFITRLTEFNDDLIRQNTPEVEVTSEEGEI